MSIITYKDVEILRNEVVVLKHVDLAVDPGQFVYLIGKVGSGKSSLMKSMYAEVPLSGGEADVLGYDLTSIKRKDIPFLRRKIGIVFQDFQLLTDRPVFDNLKFVLEATGWKNRDEMEQRIDEVLREVGMLTKAYKMPHHPIVRDKPDGIHHHHMDVERLLSYIGYSLYHWKTNRDIRHKHTIHDIDVDHRRLTTVNYLHRITETGKISGQQRGRYFHYSAFWVDSLRGLNAFQRMKHTAITPIAIPI